MSDRPLMPWQGTTRCGEPTRKDGAPCRDFEILGLGACFHHVPDDLLAEAEEITGLRRCRNQREGKPACTYIAVKGTDPPCCKVHGANKGSNLSKQASAKVIELRIADAEARVIADPPKLAELLNPAPIGNPIEALLDAAAVAAAWERITRRSLAHLEESERRYSGSRIGEQIRAEIIVHSQALNTLLTVLEKICRLNLDAKLVGIREKTAQHLEQCLAEALEASGVDLPGRSKAQQAFRRRLKVVA